MLCIVECIRIEKDERNRPTPSRRMFGPYPDEDDAMTAVEDFGKEYDNVIPHKLYPPEGIKLTVNFEVL